MHRKASARQDVVSTPPRINSAGVRRARAMDHRVDEGHVGLRATAHLKAAIRDHSAFDTDGRFVKCDWLQKDDVA
jgi:hypothetical protein